MLNVRDCGGRPAFGAGRNREINVAMETRRRLAVADGSATSVVDIYAAKSKIALAFNRSTGRRTRDSPSAAYKRCA